MATNLELKARIVSAARAHECARTLGASFEGVLAQRDTYFRVASGRLKLREFAEGGAELIFYEREESTSERWSRYEKGGVADPTALLRVLGCAFGIRVVVEKARTLYLYGSARIHVDEVARLGTFIEFEIVGEEPAASRATMRLLRDAFFIGESDVVRVSYSDLLLAKRNG